MPRRGPARVEPRDTRQALLDASLDLFADRGYFGTGLRDIAQAVGVRESALYHYFTGKEALFAAIVSEPIQNVSREGMQVLEQPITDPRAVLIRAGHAIIAHFSTDRERKLFRVMMSDGMRLALEGKIDFFERTNAGATLLPKLMDKLVRECWLDEASGEFLSLQFLAPFTLWRQIFTVQPDHALIADTREFVETHVDFFLRGAGRYVSASLPREPSPRSAPDEALANARSTHPPAAGGG